MYFLVGLGNPGSSYERNRHNIGFTAIEAIAAFYHFPAFAKKGQVLWSEGTIQGEKVILLKPQQFMNISGPPLVPFFTLYKAPLPHWIVFHDDLDLALARVKIKIGGGHGGHNGLRSLDQHLGNNYTRVRIGIDRPPVKDMVSSYVLSNFTTKEEQELNPLLTKIAENTPLLFNSANHPLFMTRLSQGIAKASSSKGS